MVKAEMVAASLEKLSPDINLVTKSARFVDRTLVKEVEPGEVLLFRYAENKSKSRLEKNEHRVVDSWHKRLVLVVRNDTERTTYISLRSNMLLTVFRLDGVSPEVQAIVLKHLYKKKDACSRIEVISGLKAILGIERYRSFIIRHMYDTLQLRINTKSLFQRIKEGLFSWLRPKT